MHRYRGLVIKLLVSMFALLLSLGLPLNTLAQEDFKVYLPVILSDGSGDSPPLFPQAPDVPPSNFADLLEENVAAGIWTMSFLSLN